MAGSDSHTRGTTGEATPPTAALFAGVADFLRRERDAILGSWERKITSEPREVELRDLALRNDIPEVLDELAAWLPSGTEPETGPLADRALAHVLQRLDAGFPLRQLFREYRVLRETIAERVLLAESAEQGSASPDGGRAARVVELARLNAGLDVLLAQTVERFVLERDRRAAEALRASEALNAFQLVLSDALRPLSDAEEIHATVTRMALGQLKADRCYYCELHAGNAIIRRDAAAADGPSVAGTYPLDSFPIFKMVVTRGRPVVVEDAATTSILDEDLRRLCLELGIRSFLDVPVIKDGTPLGILCVTQAAPRRWTEQEVRLAVETAERTWLAVERARSDRALLEANARLMEADQRKNEFLAVLSHELRNPLAPIRNSVYILDRVAPGTPQAVRARQVIDRQVRHMARLIDDLLDVTRISRGKVVLQDELVDLVAVARSTAEDHRETFARVGIELEVEAPGEPVWVNGDRTRLAQVIGNLLSNAAKFTNPGGETVVSVETSDGRAVIRVRDDGAGMSPGTLAHLFEPFMQAAQTIARTRGGLGLGLALVKGLVELHGGTVTAHSRGEGQGSEFTVSLPWLAGHAGTDPAQRRAEHRVKRPRRVLVIEDNVDAAQSLREALTVAGHEVTVAYTGPEGLQAARAWHPELIFCDIGLPELDGHGIARAIRGDADPGLRHTLLVALSGYASPEDVVRSREAGFDRHIAKPASPEVLDDLLDEHLGG